MADDGCMGWYDSLNIVDNGVNDQSVDGGNESGGEGDEGKAKRQWRQASTEIVER